MAITLCVLCGCTASKEDTGRNTKSVGATVVPQSASPQERLSSPAKAAATIRLSGEFRKPGEYPWTNGMTLKDAIGAAGGFSEFATRKLSLWHSDGTAEHYRLGPSRTLTNNPALRPGDAIKSPYFDL